MKYYKYSIDNGAIRAIKIDSYQTTEFENFKTILYNFGHEINYEEISEEEYKLLR